MLSMENDDELRLGEDSISDKIVEDISLSRYLIAFDLQLPANDCFDLLVTKLICSLCSFIQHVYLVYLDLISE